MAQALHSLPVAPVCCEKWVDETYFQKAFGRIELLRRDLDLGQNQNAGNQPAFLVRKNGVVDIECQIEPWTAARDLDVVPRLDGTFSQGAERPLKFLETTPAQVTLT